MILDELPTLFQGLNGCSQETANINAAQAYYMSIKNMDPDQRFITVIKALRKQKAYLGEQYKILQDDWNSSNFFGVGEQAEILLSTVFPAPTSEEEVLEAAYGMDQNMIPDMIAGWAFAEFGLAPFSSQDALKSYMESCFVLDPTAAATVDTAMDIIAKGGEDNIKAGALMIVKEVPVLFQGLSGCSQEKSNIDGVMGYFNYIKSMDADERFTTVIKNLKKNYGKITADYNRLEK